MPPTVSKEQHQAIIAELAQRELCKRKLLPFTKRFNPRYTAGWVHEDIAHRLEQFSADVIAGKSPRLMLLVPPRHGKSELASRNFPAWHLGHAPDHEIIACSYNLSLAMTFSKAVKQIINDPFYETVFPETRVDPNNSSNEEWGVEGKRGIYFSAGVAGGATGRGAHVLIIDDPVKNSEEAESSTVLDGIWNWYGSTAYTRLAPGGGVLIIQTWWADGDLAGRIQQMMAEDPDFERFEIIRYPAIAEEYEYRNPATYELVRSPTPLAKSEVKAQNLEHLRDPGDALHPERYSTQALFRIKKTLPERYWNALYQQNPIPDEGAYFRKDYLRTMEAPDKSECYVYQAWDFAISEKQINDYTVGTTGLHDSNDLIHIVDMVRMRSGDSQAIVDAMVAQGLKWRNKSTNITIGVEDGQIWRTLSTLFFRECKKKQFYPNVVVLKPVTDKQVRARPLQGRMQQGTVIFPPEDKAPWMAEAKRELLRFPVAAHDDIVDSLAWLIHLSIDKPPPQKVRHKSKQGSWRDRIGATQRGSHMAA